MSNQEQKTPDVVAESIVKSEDYTVMADAEDERGPREEMDISLNLFGEDIEKNLSFMFID